MQYYLSRMQAQQWYQAHPAESRKAGEHTLRDPALRGGPATAQVGRKDGVP
jgi:hypothetical protein